MKLAQQLAKRFREVFLDGLWIANTNYKLQLSSISYKEANYKVGSLNTIADLTFHINYYVEGILNVLNGGNLEIKDIYSFDYPPIYTEAEWQSLVQSLMDNSEKFASAVAFIEDEKLEESFADPKYGTLYRNIEGMIEHAYYHMGQISLLRKMILELDLK